MKKTVNSFFFLQLALSLMFIVIGIQGINSYNSGGAELLRGINKTFGGSNDVIPIIMAIIEIAAGILLAGSLFKLIPNRLLSILLLIIFIFWAFNIVLSYFFNNPFEPTFIKWLASISPQLVILASIWIVFRNCD
ncbi:MAG: hypothetical protein JEZ04_09630 [Spirochaetales bacterium]|nr:hypothetical protein [Spirochaetales bacterium]